MFKKTLLSLSIVSLLTACGGSSSDNTNDTDNSNAISGTEYRVIDGYLGNANICIIAEDATDCTDIGKTNSEGIIVVPENYTAGQIVATATAGQTSDKDGVGFIAQTYQMLANISADTPNVITPYTTLDALDTERSMTDIANELELDEALISGDYVASTASDRAQVHSLARAIVTQLSKQKDDNNVDALITQATQINDYIKSDLINDGLDLDLNNIFINKEGTITHQPSIKSLSDFLENGELTYFSLNISHFAEEGAKQVTFSDGELDFDGVTGSYKIEGNQLTTLIDSETGIDNFIYVSNTLSLSVPSTENDLTVLHKSTDESIEWTDADLIGETFYFIFDDSANSKTPVPSFLKVIFSESTVTMIEGEETMTIGWSLKDGIITFNLSEQGESDLVFEQYFSDNNITLLRSEDDNRPLTLVLKDENLAKNIISEWLLLNLTK
jgi:hypothetical protein